MSWLAAKNTPELDMKEYAKVFPTEPTETHVEFLVYTKGERPGIHVFGSLPDGQKVRGFVPTYYGTSGNPGPLYTRLIKVRTPANLHLRKNPKRKAAIPILEES